ncbi:MAG: hypothetical protein HQ513_08555 [Rhodospirillales bacterium]|nr:hypothetical protein [Rhodospirillales bacterium]
MRIKRYLGTCLLIVFGFTLTGCAASVPTPTFPELTFGHLGLINLNVASLEIVSSYKSPMAVPNVEHRFPTPPGVALKRWADDRLKAAGTSARARFTILDASVRETTLEMQKGLKGAFTKDQSERYDGVLEATLEIIDDNANSKGFANAKVSRSITVREDATVNDRMQAWFKLNEALLQDINSEFEKNISQYLGNWLM